MKGVALFAQVTQRLYSALNTVDNAVADRQWAYIAKRAAQPQNDFLLMLIFLALWL